MTKGELGLYKKVYRILLIIVSLIFIKINYLKATIINSGHDLISVWRERGGVEGENQGVCSFCHIPHFAQGSRLWSGDELTEVVKTKVGQVGAMCSSCHSAPPTATAPVMDEIITDAGNRTHPLKDTYTVPETNQKYSGWPYTDGQLMECSTCHNPHEQHVPLTSLRSRTNSIARLGNFTTAPMYETGLPLSPEPRKIANLDTLYVKPNLPALFCSYCHQQRAYDTSGQKTHVLFKRGNFTRDKGNGVYIDTTIFAEYETISEVAYDSMNPNPGGGHLSYFETGTIICNTCHKPHGAAPGGKLLVYDNRHNPSNNTIYDSMSALCESCHDKNPSLHDSTNIYFSHPVDTTTIDLIDSKGRNIYNNIPTQPLYDENWPTIDSTNRKGIVCMTCHKPHQAQIDTEMLRESKKGDKRICDDCHCKAPKAPTGMSPGPGPLLDSTNPLADHGYGTESHPIHITLNTSDYDTVIWPNNDWLRLFDLSGGKIYNSTASLMDSGLVSCETCHNVHRAYRKPILEYPGDDYSEICVGCHTDYKRLTQGKNWVKGKYVENTIGGINYTDPFNSSRNNYIISQGTGGYYTYESIGAIAGNDTTFSANPSRYISEYTEDVVSRLGTHISGIKVDILSDDSTQANLAGPASAGFVFRGIFSRSNQKASWGTKSNGTRDTTIICQSCHTPHGAATGLVEENRGASSTDPTPNSALLLDYNDSSNLCIACHRAKIKTGTTDTVIPIVAHPMNMVIQNGNSFYDTFWYVRNLEAQILLNVFKPREGDSEPIKCYCLRDGLSLPANFPGNKLVCDSCHTPHAAEISSGSKILDSRYVVDSSNFDPAYNLDRNTQFGGQRYYKGKYDPSKFCHQCHSEFKGEWNYCTTISSQ